jgi:hypothetical protein
MTKSPKREMADYITQARKAADLLIVGLPKEVSIGSFGVWSKGPYLAFCLREALSYRMVEMTRAGCDALERNERAVGVVLARCCLENLALMFYLLKQLRARDTLTNRDIHEVLSKLLMGHKGDEEFPQAINVQTTLKHLDTELGENRILSMYNNLSEVAHPNYGGVHGLFAKVNYEEFRTTFGPDVRGEPMAYQAGIALVTSAELYNHYYDKVGDAIEAWIPTLSPLTGPRDPD